MTGRGCQLLVSPCNVSPSMSMMGGRRAAPQRANPGSCVNTDKMKKRVNGSFASESLHGSLVVLPSLCLRRQVLTNGKDPNIPGRPPHKQGPARHSLDAAGHCSSQGTRFKKVKSPHSFSGFSLQKTVSGWSPSLTAHSGIDN